MTNVNINIVASFIRKYVIAFIIIAIFICICTCIFFYTVPQINHKKLIPENVNTVIYVPSLNKEHVINKMNSIFYKWNNTKLPHQNKIKKYLKSLYIVNFGTPNHYIEENFNIKNSVLILDINNLYPFFKRRYIKYLDFISKGKYALKNEYKDEFIEMNFISQDENLFFMFHKGYLFISNSLYRLEEYKSMLDSKYYHKKIGNELNIEKNNQIATILFNSKRLYNNFFTNKFPLYKLNIGYNNELFTLENVLIADNTKFTKYLENFKISKNRKLLPYINENYIYFATDHVKEIYGEIKNSLPKDNSLLITLNIIDSIVEGNFSNNFTGEICINAKDMSGVISSKNNKKLLDMINLLEAFLNIESDKLILNNNLLFIGKEIPPIKYTGVKLTKHDFMYGNLKVNDFVNLDLNKDIYIDVKGSVDNNKVRINTHVKDSSLVMFIKQIIKAPNSFDNY